MRLQHQNTFLTLRAFIYSMVHFRVAAGLVWAEAATHSLVHILEGRLIVTVRTEKIGLQQRQKWCTELHSGFTNSLCTYTMRYDSKYY